MLLGSASRLRVWDQLCGRPLEVLVVEDDHLFAAGVRCGRADAGLARNVFDAEVAVAAARTMAHIGGAEADRRPDVLAAGRGGH